MASPEESPPNIDGAKAVAAVASALGHAMGDAALLVRAFTHASRCGAQATRAETLAQANERMEFLGDAVLGAAVAQILYDRHPQSDEGHLSRLRSQLASRATLARAFEHLGLLAHARVGLQMGSDAAAWPDSVKANLAEAVLAAIWLDGGWQALRPAVERLLGPALEDPQAGTLDPRLRLQSWALAEHRRLPTYTCERHGGTDHLPEFRAQVTIGPHQATGTATSRRRAEAAAAEALLAQLQLPPER